MQIKYILLSFILVTPVTLMGMKNNKNSFPYWLLKLKNLYLIRKTITISDPLFLENKWNFIYNHIRYTPENNLCFDFTMNPKEDTGLFLTLFTMIYIPAYRFSFFLPPLPSIHGTNYVINFCQQVNDNSRWRLMSNDQPLYKPCEHCGCIKNILLNEKVCSFYKKIKGFLRMYPLYNVFMSWGPEENNEDVIKLFKYWNKSQSITCFQVHSFRYKILTVKNVFFSPECDYLYVLLKEGFVDQINLANFVQKNYYLFKKQYDIAFNYVGFK